MWRTSGKKRKWQEDESDDEQITTEEMQKWKEVLAEEEKREQMEREEEERKAQEEERQRREALSAVTLCDTSSRFVRHISVGFASVAHETTCLACLKAPDAKRRQSITAAQSFSTPSRPPPARALANSLQLSWKQPALVGKSLRTHPWLQCLAPQRGPLRTGTSLD